MEPIAAPSSRQIARGNYRRLYADIAWYGLLAGSTIAFLSIYVARLGANSLQIGLLTAGPAVVNLLVSLPAGRWLEKKAIIRATLWSALIQRFGFLLLIPLPLLFAPPGQIWGAILITLAMSIPGTVVAIAFNAMFADVTLPEDRAYIVGRRNMLIAITVTLTTLVSGWLLDQLSFPLNYQLVFSIGVLGAGMSTYYLSKIQQPKEKPPRIEQPLGDLARPGAIRFIDALRSAPGLRFLTRAGGQRLFRLDLVRGPFGLFLLSYFLFYTFQYLPLPLMPLFYVRELNLTDGQIGLGTAIFHLLMVFGSMQLSRISARIGHKQVLTTGALLFGFFPLMLSFARSASVYWIASFFGGIIWAFLAGGLINRLMERVPEGDRPAHMALHNLALNLGILIGSLAGPLVSEWLGLRDALLVSAGLRLLAGLLIWRSG
jgi:MFS family permease